MPVSRIPDFLDACEKALKNDIGQIEIFAFGHLGDGNLHYAVAEPADASSPLVRQRADDIRGVVYDHVIKFGGSISAEHGIGLLNRDELSNRKSQTELDLMRAIKRSIDPQNLFNPGRIFSLD